MKYLRLIRSLFALCVVMVKCFLSEVTVYGGLDYLIYVFYWFQHCDDQNPPHLVQSGYIYSSIDKRVTVRTETNQVAENRSLGLVISHIASR